MRKCGVGVRICAGVQGCGWLRLVHFMKIEPLWEEIEPIWSFEASWGTWENGGDCDWHFTNKLKACSIAKRDFWMKYRIRPYRHEQDFDRVGEFLIEHYLGGENPYLWIQPRWEYMHFHPLIKETDVGKIGVAEVEGQIAGVVHHEHDEGILYFQVPRKFAFLSEPLLDYAEATFGSTPDEKGRERRVILINEADLTLQALAGQRGYEKDGDWEVTARYDLEQGVPQVMLPEGFRLQSLAEENDLRKINQVLWRGFDHEGAPPEEHIAGRGEMQQAPNFRHDLTIIVVAPNGDYVSFCGIWYLPQNRITYVEPVATDPDYRRIGLGKAAVLEGIRRTIPLGAEVAWVGSEQEFYLAMGFVHSYRAAGWIRYR